MYVQCVQVRVCVYTHTALCSCRISIAHTANADMFTHALLAVCLFLFRLLTSAQIPVDITTGVTDEQAREMAGNLEFKGQALEEVCSLSLSLPPSSPRSEEHTSQLQ